MAAAADAEHDREPADDSASGLDANATSADDSVCEDSVREDRLGEETDATDEPAEEAVDNTQVLFYEPGGSWWVSIIGPMLIALTLGLEIAGGGRIHWEVLTIFGVVLIGFSVLQVIAARRHVSVLLTERFLHQGTRRLDLADIAKIYPENRGSEHQDWESAKALGELHAVPRRRRGVGVKLTDGSLAQAWARDVDRFRTELSEAHTAVKLGLPPTGRS